MSTQNAFAESGTSPTITARITASNDSERAECRRLMKDGFTVLRRGAPDFFAFKEVDGGMEFCFVEVKNEATDDLSQEQEQYHEALKRCGIPVKVSWYTTVEFKRVEE
jgi:hypothetical protein